MPTFTQALQLGAERLTAAPTPPDASLQNSWAALDWTGARDAALLDAAALAGVARMAGATGGPSLSTVEPALTETRPVAPAAAGALLPQLLAGEWSPLVAEWIEVCSDRGYIVPPVLLPRLLDSAKTPGERSRLLSVLAERGRWLARQNPAWAWVHAAEPTPDPALWDDGSDDERLGLLRLLRTTTPAQARELVAKTWADDAPEFRARALEQLRPGLSPADEPFLLTALTDRRKEVRTIAQGLLALLPDGVFAGRMRQRAESMLALHRGLFGRKLEVTLPAAFDPKWKADALEEKPPAGVGEKAHWTQQVLALVPVSHWTKKFDLPAAALFELARKSSDWAELLLGAWYRAATLHGDAEACAALAPLLLASPRLLPPGTNLPAAIATLLAACSEADRWRLVTAESSLGWTAISLLHGNPTAAQGRALLGVLAPDLRNGANPSGSPGAVLAACCVPPSLRDEAARLLARDNGLTKPAEAFLQALDLRAAIHSAFPITA